MNIKKEELLNKLSREDSLDLIQAYVEEKINVDTFNKKDISSEMFRLFFNVIELGREVRISIKEESYKNSESKIADIFLVLISICNSLNINLFDALTEKEMVLNKICSIFNRKKGIKNERFRKIFN